MTLISSGKSLSSGRSLTRLAEDRAPIKPKASPAPPSAHGGLIASELEALGIDRGEVLDLSVNVNPYGPCQGVRDAIAGAAIECYPDPTAAPARRAIARWLDVEDERVIVGNGAVDLLWLLARALLAPGLDALTIEPTFSELRHAATRTGARVEAFRTVPTDDFALDAGALDAALTRMRPRVLYACTPSNPVGRFVPPEVFCDLAARHPETLFVVDLSFLSLSTHHDETPWLTPARGAERIVWLRSLTKDHSLAGLRIGCAVAPAPVARRLEEERPPWSVNALAQAAASAMVSPAAASFVSSSRARLLSERGALESALRRLALRVHPSDTVFVLADLGPRSATDVRAALLRDHRILVRDCSSFGLPSHVRVAARGEVERDRVVSALGEVLAR